ncbi:hypothetical protein B0H14DRAFT_2644752 [Mycena olivaceomarginata]|nr:hypothetical protein B0H14DRAFT_2644752 [Mycena olivaceomarginata]
MKNSKNALDDTQYELKQRDRRILFAPTLTAATGFLHECPGFGPAFLQQHDGSFVRNPEVNIYFVVDWCLGSVYPACIWAYFWRPVLTQRQPGCSMGGAGTFMLRWEATGAQWKPVSTLLRGKLRISVCISLKAANAERLRLVALHRAAGDTDDSGHGEGVVDSSSPSATGGSAMATRGPVGTTRYSAPATQGPWVWKPAAAAVPGAAAVTAAGEAAAPPWVEALKSRYLVEMNRMRMEISYLERECPWPKPGGGERRWQVELQEERETLAGARWENKYLLLVPEAATATGAEEEASAPGATGGKKPARFVLRRDGDSMGEDGDLDWANLDWGELLIKIGRFEIWASAKKEKQKRPRVAKEDRQNNRLWADGAREKILKPHIPGYTEAMDQGWAAERRYWKKVCNEYHARVSWRLADHEEPDDIGSWGPGDALPVETLSTEEEAQKRGRVKILNLRIRRWFKYRIKRIRKTGSGTDPTKDPFALLLAQLCGLTSPGKARQAFQQYMHEMYDTEIAPAVTQKWADGESARAAAGQAKKPLKAGFALRSHARCLQALSKTDQEAFGARAKQEAKERREAYELALKNGPSQKPEDRQRRPQCPSTAANCGLSKSSVSNGVNRTAAADHWAQWDKTRFASNVSGYMIEYLRTAYSQEDCANAALGGQTSVRPGAANGVAVDDDSDRDSVFPSDDETDDQEDDQDEEEEEEESRDAEDWGSRWRGVVKERGVVKARGGRRRAGAMAAPRSRREQEEQGEQGEQGEQEEQEEQMEQEEEEEQEEPTMEQVIAAAEKKVLAAERKEAMAELAAKKAELAHEKARERAGDDEEDEGTHPSGGDGARHSARIRPSLQRLAGCAHREKPSTARQSERGRRHGGAAGSADCKKVGQEGTRKGSQTHRRPIRQRRGDRDASNPADTAPTTTTPDNEAPRPDAGRRASPAEVATLESRVYGAYTYDDIRQRAHSRADAYHCDTRPPTTAPRHHPVVNSESPNQIPEGRSSLRAPQEGQLLPIGQDPAVERARQAGEALGLRICWRARRRHPRGSGDARGDIRGKAWVPTIRGHRGVDSDGAGLAIRASGRPKQVGAWITNARGKRGTTPAVPDPATYAVEWQGWWDSLQPEWRRKEGDGRWSVTEGYGEGGREWGLLYHWALTEY